MRYSFFLFLCFLLCTNIVKAQSWPQLEDVFLVNPIRWGPMVYVPANISTTKFVLESILSPETEITLNCDDGVEFNWFCEGIKPLVFEGLDREGERTGDVFLCDPESVERGHKYYSEKYLAFNCGLVGGWSEGFSDPYIKPYEVRL